VASQSKQIIQRSILLTTDTKQFGDIVYSTINRLQYAAYLHQVQYNYPTDLIDLIDCRPSGGLGIRPLIRSRRFEAYSGEPDIASNQAILRGGLLFFRADQSLTAGDDEFKNDSGARHDRFKAVLAVQESSG
jgi:hypothetical protein